MNYASFKEAVAAAAAEAGIQDYELYYMEDESVSISTFQTEIESFSSSVSGGVCFRCIVNGKMGYAATELLDGEQAREIVRRAAENAHTIENADEVFLHSAGDPYQETAPYETPLPTSEQMIPFVLDCQRKAYDADSRVCDGTQARFFAGRTVVRLTNSRGLDLQNTSGFQCGLVEAILKYGGEKYSGYDYRVGDLPQISRRDLVNGAVARSAGTIGAEVAESGKYTVVFDPQVMADLLAIFCPVFSSDNAQKGLSLLKEKEGEVIAAPGVTLVDDPFYPGSTVQTSFDAEGVATGTKNVIEDGVLKTLLYNLKTAAKESRRSTGNAYKAGYASNVSIAPYSFYLKPGALSREELLRQVGSGVYITEINGGHAGASAVTGDFSLQSAGFLIENGQLGRPVRGFTMADNFFSLLKKIRLIGSDLTFGIPSGFTVFGAPTVSAEEVSIAGK